MSNRVYEIVTEKILAALEKGVVPWQQTWSNVGGGMPLSGNTGKGYRGINNLLLYISALENGFASRYWFTFKQLKKLGATLKDGEKSTLVVFWTSYNTKDKKTDEDITIPVLRYYLVFNADQIEGLPEKYYAEATTLNEVGERPEAEQVAKDYLAREGITLTLGGNRAYYDYAGNAVYLPEPGQFQTTDHYWTALFHEAVHSTGRSDRLNRKTTAEQRIAGNTHARGQEEFVAEIGAALLSSVTGLEGTFEDSASYIGTWMKDIQADPKLVVHAAAKAQRAVDYILGVTFEDAPE